MFLLRISLLLLWVTASHAGIYRWVDDNGKVHFGDRPPPKKSDVVQVQAPTHSQAVEAEMGGASQHQQTLSVHRGAAVGEWAQASMRLQQLRQFLLAGEFDRLNQGLATVSRLRERDIGHERMEVWLYHHLIGTDERFKQPLAAWIRHSPAHYQPYLARLHSLYHQAFAARGHATSAETSSQQMQRMEHWLTLAEPDIERILQRNPQALPAYTAGVWIYKLMGRDDDSQALFQRGVARLPASEALYRRYLRTLRPRWGGSYQAMLNLAQQANEQAHLNPRLELVAGEIVADMMNRQLLDRQYRQALQASSETGFEEHLILRYTGRAHHHLGQYDQAVDWLQRSVDANPYDNVSRRYLAQAHRRLEQYLPAAEAMRSVVLTEPWKEKYRQQAASLVEDMMYHMRQNLSVHSAEVRHKKLNLALELSGDDADARLQLAFYYWDIRQPERAEAEFEHLLKIAPDNLRVHRQYDRFLVNHGRQWHKIAAFWQRYLKRNPKDSIGWLEVGGTYYHMKDYRRARHAWKTAAELGNVTAQSNYERIRDW
ncbi:hypothetical protein GCM10011297_00180 [Bacterioplanes sanyensis]|uniref:DUF4124 domain-containing protein n=1 Tax=Bacterioplanes sanyensis TaxID=1249553 RepID=UPI0016740AFF|nr:DUF4124 domain-containing protein [Bacterioplanes sanyensis]GGY31451.1 hypothetical protein GCM10011297_00180 [Bacterioplanes sanyensis]